MFNNELSVGAPNTIACTLNPTPPSQHTREACKEAFCDWVCGTVCVIPHDSGTSLSYSLVLLQCSSLIHKLIISISRSHYARSCPPKHHAHTYSCCIFSYGIYRRCVTHLSSIGGEILWKSWKLSGLGGEIKDTSGISRFPLGFLGKVYKFWMSSLSSAVLATFQSAFSTICCKVGANIGVH